MCVDDVAAGHEPTGDPAQGPVLSAGRGFSRRDVLRTGGLAAAAVATRAIWVPGSSWGASANTLTGLEPILNAMHVHGSWSEGAGSWESQFAQASSIGTDVLWMTDHDFRGLAYRFINSLTGVAMATTSTGSLAQSAATIDSQGVTRVLAESSSTSTAASMTYAVPALPTASAKMRTSIAGEQLSVTFSAARIDPGATYDVVLQLSNHPAFGTRPAAQFELHYQFGDFAPSRLVDANGYAGIVRAATPAPGATVVLDPMTDVGELWPDMLAIDNSIFTFSLVATSPAKGAVVDVSASVAFGRTQNDSADLIALQQTVINTYGSRYPTMRVYPTTEISYFDPHIIPFGVPQMWPAQDPIVANERTAYASITASVHAAGGLVSYNHPFGATQGPNLPPAQQTTLRQQTFSAMLADKLMGCDILEVGYATRGSCTTQTFIDLWDTFSRHAMFLTGNGVNDDHGGLHWATLANGFTTGIWAQSPSETDLVAALGAGRAYTYHAGLWPSGKLDLLVGSASSMGKVEVTAKTSRQLQVYAQPVPAGGFVDVVQGPVDYTGVDPGTKIVASRSSASLGTPGLATVHVDTTTSTFVRVQVRNRSGAIIGISNPVWMLKSPPTTGIPTPRAV